MSQHRQLLAVMFTDMEGYSAIMQANEQQALVLKNRHRQTLQREHDRYHGRLIQYYGDGSLSIFQSAVEAVACALAMQTDFRQSPPVAVRIGLHLGDVVFDEEQLFGDGVNIASRIESLGVAGSVLLSDRVREEILNHPEMHTITCGSYKLKNIGREIEVFALDHSALVVPAPDTLQGKTEPTTGHKLRTSNKAPAKSIAVLPLANLSNDPEQEYFSEGVAEEIINALSNLKDLKVAGRTSSFRFNGKNADLKEVGKKLGVTTVLEGSVRKQGNRLRITVQLVKVDDGFHLWSERYDRTMDDIFAIQEEIALAVKEKMQATLLDNSRTTLSLQAPPTTEAYDLYLQGRFYLNRRGASIIKAINFLQQAIAADPNFALAYAGFADANLMAGLYGFAAPKDVMPRAKQAAEKAIQLDPSLSEPYCSLGYYACYEWNAEAAEQNFLKAIERNPRNALAHLWYGVHYLAWMKGDFDKAEEQGKIGIKLEPLSSIGFGIYAQILHAAGKFEEALAACKTGIELDPNAFLCRLYEGYCYVFLEQYTKGMATLEQLLQLSNRHSFVQGALVMALCKTGERAKARVLLDELKERAEQTYVVCTVIGLSEGWLEDLDEAFKYLHKGLEEHDPMILSLRYEYWVAPVLRADPRFQALLDTMATPQRAAL